MSDGPRIGQGMPTDDSWITRKFEELQRQIVENRAGQTLNAASVGTAGLTISNGSFEMPLITPGEVPGSMWWDDGLPNHSAIFAFVGGIVLQGGWDDSIAVGDNSYLFISPATGGVSNALGFSLGLGGRYICATPSGQNAEIFINALGSGARGIDIVNTGPGGSEKINLGNGGTGAVQINPQVHMQFAGGLNGMYYYEDFDLATQTVTTGAQATLVGMTAGHQLNDYSSAMNTTTGVWVCPETGPYTFTLRAGFTAWTSAAHLGLRILNQSANRVIASRDAYPATTGAVAETVSARAYCTQGDTVIHQLTNGTAGSQTVTTSAPEQGYISIQREL